MVVTTESRSLMILQVGGLDLWERRCWLAKGLGFPVNVSFRILAILVNCWIVTSNNFFVMKLTCGGNGGGGHQPKIIEKNPTTDHINSNVKWFASIKSQES